MMMFEAPLVDAPGRQIGWMGSILDITEPKRLLDRERGQTETMAHHARLTMPGEVAATLAQELNQPLTAISRYSAGGLNSLQRADAAQPADPLVLRALQRLGEQAAQAGRSAPGDAADVDTQAAQRRIEVSDNGPGLQGRRIDALCPPFYSTKVEGMGMGLAICRLIVEAHHGALDAHEAPGGGACFSLTLPVAVKVAAVIAEKVAARALRPPPPTASSTCWTMRPLYLMR